ncbi:MAG: hypothetical protein HFJ74_05480 [Eggerthellaceae bacterium]|nr:hypothetical protein [Eggerthellaceae bacterium]
MICRDHIRDAFHAAVPIMLGYVAIGIPCGILCDSIGLNALQVFLLSALFYSGAGQFMIPNMYLAASPLASIIASVSLVNTRQMLYAASFAPECQGVSKRVAFFFAATVTDESYGVSTAKFAEGGWSVDRALMVNLFSQSSWALSNVAGVLVGSAIGIPLNIAAFAMTAIFICLLVTQRMTSANIVAIVLAMAGVYLCKAVGLTGPAILVGALLGVVGAMAYASLRDRRIVAKSAQMDAALSGGDGAGSAKGEHVGETPQGMGEARGATAGEQAEEDAGRRTDAWCEASARAGAADVREAGARAGAADVHADAAGRCAAAGMRDADAALEGERAKPGACGTDASRLPRAAVAPNARDAADGDAASVREAAANGAAGEKLAAGDAEGGARR